MSKVIDTLEREQLRKVPSFQAGDRVKVHFQVIEGTRRRTQVFEGVVLKRQGTGVRETFTVRKQSFGVGVERMFPVHSPKIERIEVASRGDVRRAKLYYLRGRVGKRARVRERQHVAGEELLVATDGGATDERGIEQEEAAVLSAEEGVEITPDAAADAPAEGGAEEQPASSETADDAAADASPDAGEEAAGDAAPADDSGDEA